jgi:hypothetical protein
MYSEQQIQVYINKAQQYLNLEESGLVNILNMKKDLAYKLYICANIKTVEDLSTRNETYIHDRLIACSEQVQYFTNCSTSLTGSENHLSSLRFQTFNRKVF